jgi:DNA polymerase III delta prime subunit
VFIEKHRPKTFKEIIGQKNIVKTVKGYIKEKEIIPNLLFVGGPGLGKTTISLVIARKLFGESYKDSLLELNASTDRGIDVVRRTIREFARTKGFNKFKIIFLDEADAITKDAQHALRRIMEVYHNNCRFILSCNYPEKIISPIKSRCTEFVFKSIKKEDLKILTKRICKKEKIKIKKNQAELLILESNGDARRLLNGLEALNFGKEMPEVDYDDLLSLSVGEFQKLAYSIDNDFILNRLIDQVFKKKNRKAVLILADCDARFRLGCIKSLQLVAAFLKLQSIFGG